MSCKILITATSSGLCLTGQVFLSYSRLSGEVAGRLRTALEVRTFSPLLQCCLTVTLFTLIVSLKWTFYVGHSKYSVWWWWWWNWLWYLLPTFTHISDTSRRSAAVSIYRPRGSDAGKNTLSLAWRMRRGIQWENPACVFYAATMRAV